MEDTLRVKNRSNFGSLNEVLILVLMEDTLREVEKYFDNEEALRLNPCFNGRYSQRPDAEFTKLTAEQVLILVLMEDTLRGYGV